MPLPNTLNKWMKPSVGKFSSPSALNNPKPTTSISRSRTPSSVKTSISDKPIESASSNRFDSKKDQTVMDSRRYSYMRKLIKERQKKEKNKK